MEYESSIVMKAIILNLDCWFENTMVGGTANIFGYILDGGSDKFLDETHARAITK